MDTDCTIPGKTSLHIDTTAFVPENGAELGVLPCAIDADENENILAAYKFNGTDFLVKDFINMTLAGKPEDTTQAPTQESTQEITEQPDTTAPADTQSKGCGAMMSGAMLALLLPAAVVLKKKKR